MATQIKQKPTEDGKEEIKDTVITNPVIVEPVPGEDKVAAQALFEKKDGRRKTEEEKAKTRAARLLRQKKAREQAKNTDQAEKIESTFGPVSQITMKDIAEAVLGDAASDAHLDDDLIENADQPVDEAVLAGDNDGWIAEDDADTDDEADGFLPESADGHAIEAEASQAEKKPKAAKKKRKQRPVGGIIAAHIAQTPFGLSVFDHTEVQHQNAVQALRLIENFMRVYGKARSQAMADTGKLPNSGKFIVENFNDGVAEILGALKLVLMNPLAEVYFRGQGYCDKFGITSMLDLFEMAPAPAPGKPVNLVGFYEALYQVMQVYYRAGQHNKAQFFMGVPQNVDEGKPADPDVEFWMRTAISKAQHDSSKAGYPIIPASMSDQFYKRRNQGVQIPMADYHKTVKDEFGYEVRSEEVSLNPRYKAILNRFKTLFLRELNLKLSLAQSKAETQAIADAQRDGGEAPKPRPFEKLEVLPVREEMFITNLLSSMNNKWLNAAQLGIMWELEIIMSLGNADLKTGFVASEFRDMFIPVIKGFLWDRSQMMGDAVAYYQYLLTALKKGEETFDPTDLNKRLDDAVAKDCQLFMNPYRFNKPETKQQQQQQHRPRTPLELVKAVQALSEAGLTNNEISLRLTGKPLAEIDEMKPVLASLEPVGSKADEGLNQADEDLELAKQLSQ